MVKKFRYRDIDWIDLESPTAADIRTVRAQYDIHSLVADELSEPSLRPKVDFHRKHIYLILHFPVFSKTRKHIYSREVDFIVGKGFLITAHYEPIKPLHDISEIFELENLVGDDEKVHAGYLLFYIIRHLYESLEENLLIINKAIDHAEEDVFNGREHDMVRHLSYLGKLLLDFKKAIKSHGDVLVSFEQAGKQFFGEEFIYYLTAMSGEYYKIWNQAEGSRETLNDLKATNDSLLNTRTNDIMKVLTIMAFITFPLSLIAGIFGMNTSYLPIVGKSEHDFWIIIGLMLGLTLLFFAFFKYKRWF